jgi:uncharacterized surface protein with fasciclin (FAS1) repeats
MFLFLRVADSPILPDICEIVDFRKPGEFPDAKVRSANVFGSRQHRALDLSAGLFPMDLQVRGSVDSSGHRRLQFQGERCDNNILDVAREDPSLSTFVELIDAAGLDDLFFCAGPFTALIPTNDAFADLDPGLVEELLLPENQETLQEILLYHVLPGYQPSTSLEAGPTDTLLDGTTVEVGLSPITFNNVSVVEPDIAACNGVIHTIGDVLSQDGAQPEPTTKSPTLLTFAPIPPPVKTPVVAQTKTPIRPATAAPMTAPMTVPVAPPVEPPVEPPVAIPIVAPVAAVTAAPVAAVTGAPVPAPTTAPAAASNEQTVRLQDFYISYVAPGATREPTVAEYAEMLNRTSNYFQRYFETYYANDPNVEFVSIKATTDFTRYGPDAGIPEAKFNIYINFALTDLTFTADSTPPDAKALFDILAASTSGQDGVTYILTEVQTFTGSPFETTNEVFLAATEVAPP